MYYNIKISLINISHIKSSSQNFIWRLIALFLFLKKISTYKVSTLKNSFVNYFLLSRKMTITEFEAEQLLLISKIKNCHYSFTITWWVVAYPRAYHIIFSILISYSISLLSIYLEDSFYTPISVVLEEVLKTFRLIWVVIYGVGVVLMCGITVYNNKM